LDQLIHAGVVTSLVVHDGDLLVQVASQTPSSLALIHDAVIDALRSGTWLPTPEWTNVTIRPSAGSP
jgi:hypothetical protein